MPETSTVRLGDHLLPVVPQRQARLRHRIRPEDFEKVMSKDYGSESYRLLCVFIPALESVPLWEYEGYSSQEAMDAGEYDEATDKSPTTAEIIDAFETAINVSGGDRLGKLLSLVTSVGSMTT